MTEPDEDPKQDLEEKAFDQDPNRESGPSEPWAKTSSGDKDSVTPDDGDDERS
jgi:hypothetical protein